MDEHAARQVLLVRAIETTDATRQLLSDDDRAHASDSALALARWDASASKKPLTRAQFLQTRAGLILKRMEQRVPAFATFANGKSAVASVANALPLIGLLAGVLVDRVSDPHRVNLLSAPLLGIIAWNWVVYSMLLFGLAASLFQRAPAHHPWVDRLMRLKTPAPGILPQPLTTAVAAFSADWLAATAPLTRLRLLRAMHFSAAAFALGAIISLYARGLLSQYLAGWESTFLDAQQVHTALSLLFWPATAVFHLTGFSIAEVQALRSPESGNAAAGALWVHLYAATLLLWAMLPRLVLAGFAAWQEKRLARRIPIDLGQPYFRQLMPKTGPDLPAVLRVFPYSFTVDEARDNGLATVAKQLLGKKARVMLRPSTRYGHESEGPVGSSTDGGADVTRTVVLFNLNATPEPENHGAFLERFVKESATGPAGTSGPTGFSVLIDESAYVERMGGQKAGADRVQHRIRLWREFCAHYEVEARIVNLVNPLSRQEELEPGLSRPATVQ
jgi:MFS family permease